MFFLDIVLDLSIFYVVHLKVICKNILPLQIEG